ncbi:MAG TPA: alpha-amylase family glycosyl hydrolase [Longimicrobium sp.]|jgi:1,4-alpha-glucan branching enzyme|uniref:alpha-amylase family glycosyl hydrolase n=1 Tax=Longimicrobium sp. TaxID=2029185 RepID=UPI002ED9C86E
MIEVRFTYLTGLKRPLFHNARLRGSWDANGRYAGDWTDRPMQAVTAEDGCPAFTATVQLDESGIGQVFRWGVALDGPAGAGVWAIPTETPHTDEQRRYREFTLDGAAGRHERFHLTYSRWLGAQKHHAEGQAPALRFAVWAPNAGAADVVFSAPTHGYVADDGSGIDPAMPVIPLHRRAEGIWESDPVADFAAFTGAPYMFRIRNAQGQTVYRTDLHSRWQIGRGDVDPARAPWNGDPHVLDGGVSCSVVIDQDVVRQEFEPAATPPALMSDDDFWAGEFTPGRPVPTRVEDLVIYELHIGSLGFGGPGPGTLADAMAFLDYLVDLGVNAVELLPISEFSGNLGWGYGDTHHFVIESSAGGRDKYKHFVRECHRRGIAVIQDVVYNHFDPNAERAEWQYDSTLPEQNIYYWYQGASAGYADPNGGYVDNGSTGWTPRFREEPVRHLFTSSAAEFVEEFHVDGLRVDLTQAIHRDNVLHADGSGVGAANLFGQKFLREWSRTLRMVRPSVMLMAEDHTGWDAVTKLPDAGGLGFDSTWFAAFYHNLIGDADAAPWDAARLLRQAGTGSDGPLAMGRFAAELYASRFSRVVYHESHDEAGNAGGSMRTAKVAVGNAPLAGATRAYAEARCRVVAGLSLLSAGTPMFFMGEEVVAQNLYKYDNILQAREDLHGERAGAGANMFRFYRELIALRHAHPAVRSHEIDVIHAYDPTRVLAFTRRQAQSELLVVASLNNQPFLNGYVLQTGWGRLPAGMWREIFNSDSAAYGGSDVGNYGASLPSDGARLELRLPANGFVVLQRL